MWQRRCAWLSSQARPGGQLRSGAEGAPHRVLPGLRRALLHAQSREAGVGGEDLREARRQLWPPARAPKVAISSPSGKCLARQRGRRPWPRRTASAVRLRADGWPCKLDHMVPVRLPCVGPGWYPKVSLAAMRLPLGLHRVGHLRAETTHTCPHTHTHTHLHTHLHTHTYTHTHPHAYTHLHTPTHTPTHTLTHTYTHTYTHTHLHTHTHTLTHTHTYTHTHSHTHTPRNAATLRLWTAWTPRGPRSTGQAQRERDDRPVGAQHGGGLQCAAASGRRGRGLLQAFAYEGGMVWNFVYARRLLSNGTYRPIHDAVLGFKHAGQDPAAALPGLLTQWLPKRWRRCATRVYHVKKNEAVAERGRRAWRSGQTTEVDDPSHCLLLTDLQALKRRTLARTIVSRARRCTLS